MFGLNRPEIEKLLAGTTAGAWAWAAHDGDPNDDLTYRGFPWIEREPTGAPGDDGDLLATCSNPGDARLMAAAPELARQCLALLDRAEAADQDRGRLALLVRAALNGKLAGPWVRVDAKHDAWARTGAAVCLAGSVTTEDRTFKGTRDDADAKLIAHGWTLMDEADAKLIAGGSDAD